MSVSESLAEMRRRYERHGLRKSDCAASPIEQLNRWLSEALSASPGEWFEVNAMSLATCGADGHVTSRVVLLKGVSDAGLKFYTNYDSEKGRQLAENPRASLNFYWPHLERQVRITGAVSRVSREDSRQYFRSRPRGSQLGASISRQSEVVASRDALADELAAAEQKLQGADVPLPEQWGGYLLAPDSFEFWQGRPDRLHDRIRYSPESAGWRIERLSP